MRVQRPRSTLPSRRRRAGCIPFTFLSGIGFGVMIAAIAWLGGWLGLRESDQISRDLASARQAFEHGDLDTVIERTSAIYASHPEHADALTLLIRALIYRSYADYDHITDRQKALNITAQAYERLPHSLDVIAARAFALQTNGQSEAALQLARYVTGKEPSHTLARITLGLAYGGIGAYAGALNIHQETLQSEQLPVDSHRALAISYSDLGQYEQAIAALDEAIRLNERLLMLHFERAEYALHQGDADAATASYFRVMAYDAQNVKARLRLCDLSTTLRESSTALRYCGEVTQLAPDWVDGWYYLGKEYFIRGDFKAAQDAFHECTTLSVEQHIPVIERRFDCWYQQGQAAEILGDCDSLLQIYGEFKLMTSAVNIPQTWTYPPEGPAICQTSNP